MNITGINGLEEISRYSSTQSSAVLGKNRNAAFETIFQAAAGLIKETANYTNEAEEAEIAFSLGLMDNTHDLQIAQQKANIALQFTVAVRNQVLEAYKEIMNLQF